jgi:hypothetical protein
MEDVSVRVLATAAALQIFNTQPAVKLPQF